mmetsp:Transcript_29472/g.44705  ORF Transcript_29472/g.44705 Transcript_29472/m.44705 type:complete len:188 (+) Transcript_29472:1756-2319(+)
MFQEELDIVMSNLSYYFEYIKQNPDSLIARIYGVFQVQMEGIVPVNLLLMANTIQNVCPKNKIVKVYDLKGSWTNRIVHVGEKQTLKDRNLLNCKQARFNREADGLLQFDFKHDMKLIKEAISRDANFLQGLGLLDYSLLLAVERLEKPETITEDRQGSQLSKDHRLFCSLLSNQKSEMLPGNNKIN